MLNAKKEAITSTEKIEGNMRDRNVQKITKKRFSILIGILMITALVLATELTYKKHNNYYSADAETLRAMTYEELSEEDENVEGTDNVKFSAFFLRDINGDGYAEKIKGTCKQVTTGQDTLYMEIVVQTAGKLKNGKIEIDGKNFYLQTTLPKDTELKANYIGENVKTIEFEDLNNGTQKLLTAVVKSGDYNYNSTNKAAIGNNTSNYSRSDNMIIFTGTYVAEDGVTETEIRKEMPITVDWYGVTATEIYTSRWFKYNEAQNYYDIANRIDEENETLTVDFVVRTEETKQQLNLFSNHAEGTIPQLNGYNPMVADNFHMMKKQECLQ